MLKKNQIFKNFEKKNSKRDMCTYDLHFAWIHFFIFTCCVYKLYHCYFQSKRRTQLSIFFLSLSYSAKNNAENNMNLNDGQTDWTLIAAIVISIIVVASFIVIVIILYIRKTSKLIYHKNLC